MANYVTIVIPTAINITNAVHENAVTNLLKGLSSDLELPSLYKLAQLIVNEGPEIAVVIAKNS